VIIPCNIIVRDTHRGGDQILMNIGNRIHALNDVFGEHRGVLSVATCKPACSAPAWETAKVSLFRAGSSSGSLVIITVLPVQDLPMQMAWIQLPNATGKRKILTAVLFPSGRSDITCVSDGFKRSSDINLRFICPPSNVSLMSDDFSASRQT
jgi:hypothetical protein